MEKKKTKRLLAGIMLMAFLAVSIASASEPMVMPDFEVLAEDLVYWNHPDRYIQRKWLRTICSNNYQTNNNEEEEKNVD